MSQIHALGYLMVIDDGLLKLNPRRFRRKVRGAAAFRVRGSGGRHEAGAGPGPSSGDRRGVAAAMTRREVLAWLEARRPIPPDALRACLEAAVTDAELPPLVPLPDQLAVLGRCVLGRVAGRPEGGRELALELLAADAFITYAFEAQAEADATGLAGLAERIAGSEP